MRYILGAALALLLAACGGGGSSLGVASTYHGDELAAFDLLNAKRTQCGFGPLVQSAQLDQSAAAHVRYMAANPGSEHWETAGQPGFTGHGPKERAAAAGYVGSVGEILAGPWPLLPHGDIITEILMDVPYHAAVALEPLRDVGIAYGDGAIVIDPGLAAGAPKQLVSGVHTYPCNGVTGVFAQVIGESPAPFPNDPPGMFSGPTISVVGHAVRVTAASVTGPDGAMPIKAILGDGQTKDINGFCTGANACIVLEPLQWASTYTVHVEGSDDGAPFSTDFRFMTADQTGRSVPMD